MPESKLTYMGPLGPSASAGISRIDRVLGRLPLAFLLCVVLPTLVALVYFLFIASPIYVSEARFVVRSQANQTPSSLGLALQSAGIANSQSDAFAVHEYIKSRDAVLDLERRFQLRDMLGGRGADAFSRFPQPWEGHSQEALYRGLQRFITVGYDSTNGISTIRVEAFSPQDSQALTKALLEGGEAIVNRMNERAATQSVVDSTRLLEEAESRLATAQQRIGEYRNQQGFIDPTRSALSSAQLTSALAADLTALLAERAQVAASAPQSPLLAALDSRIDYYRRAVAAEEAKVAGSGSSLAPKIGQYEDLVLDRELADREVVAARTAMIEAKGDARRQQLYLERVVEPGLPDEPTEPKRWLAILAVFASALLIYGLGWLVWAGVQEHRQH